MLASCSVAVLSWIVSSRLSTANFTIVVLRSLSCAELDAYSSDVLQYSAGTVTFELFDFCFILLHSGEGFSYDIYKRQML